MSVPTILAPRLALGLFLLGATCGAAAAGCLPDAASACTLQLHGDAGQAVSESCKADAWTGHLTLSLPERVADGNADGWREAVVELDLDPRRGCSCAVARIHFAEPPSGYSLDVCDSPTCNGKGGDYGSTRYNAELTILGEEVLLDSADHPGAGTDRFAVRLPEMEGRVLEVEICDQHVELELDGESFLGAYSSAGRHSFAIAVPADDAVLQATRPDSRVYLGFNRVIHDRSGTVNGERYGTGIARVELFLTP